MSEAKQYCDSILADDLHKLRLGDLARANELYQRAKANGNAEKRNFWSNVEHDIKVNGTRFGDAMSKECNKRRVQQWQVDRAGGMLEYWS